MVWLLALVSLAAAAQAEGPAGPAAPHRVSGVVEAGASHAELTDGNASWDDQYVRGAVHVSAADRVAAEVTHQRHFGDGGTYLGLGYTRILDEAWYASLGGGASDRGIFLPRLRLDGTASRKWLERRRLVTTLGATYLRSRGPYWDLGVTLGAAYYLEAPWILEAGVRVAHSNPGAARSTRGWLAVTQGRARRHQLTLRAEGGNEAWQLVAADAVLVDFQSFEAALVWRQWLAGGFGVSLRGTHYRSSNYDRTSVDLGVFSEF